MNIIIAASVAWVLVVVVTAMFIKIACAMKQTHDAKKYREYYEASYVVLTELSALQDKWMPWTEKEAKKLELAAELKKLVDEVNK